MSDERFWLWLGGLFDGEGCFCIGLIKESRRPSKLYFAPTIRLAILKEGGEEYIKSIPINTRLGRVMETKRSNPQCVWYVQGINKCIEAAEKLAPFLKVKKDTCQKFLKICYLLKKGVHYTKSGFLKVARLRDELNSRLKPNDYRYASDIEPILPDSSNQGRPWTKTEVDYLQQVYPTEAAKDIARRLRRSTTAVIRKARKTNLKSQKYWSKEEDEKLRELYPNTSSRAIGKLLNRSRNGVIKRATRLKIKSNYRLKNKGERWSQYLS